MCNKAIDIYPSPIKFIPECFKTREMYGKAVDGFLLILKFVSDWFVTNKIIKKFIVLYLQ